MGYWARAKSIVGRRSVAVPSVASATSIDIGEVYDTWLVTGTTTITNINLTGPYYPGRIIVLMFSGSLSLTDTAVGSTAQGKLHTGSTSPAAGTAIAFICANNGSWWQFGYSANG